MIWKITSKHAILHYEKKILQLYEYIHIYNPSKNTKFLSIIANQITIHLINNDIFSNNTTILHDYHFYSIGKQMRGNLYTKIIKLTDNTHTYYAI